MLDQQPPSPATTHALAVSAMEKAVTAEEIAQECRGMFYDLKKTIKVVADAVLEYHAERQKLTADIARFRKMNLVLVGSCGLTAGLFGGMVIVLFVKALGH